MISDGERLEQHLYVVRSLVDRDGLSVEQVLAKYPGLVPAEDHAAVIRLWQDQTSTTIRVLEPTELSRGGPRPWFDDWDTSRGYYWRRQRRFLKHVLHRPDFAVDAIDRSSDRVLAHLEDPCGPDRFDVRGLVVGHVQSGKTANFSALIAKAADAGYRIVIVLSGLHNSLRQQTQRRLQRDLGHEDSLVGVGQGEPDKWWTWMTDDRPDGDFNPHGANAGFLQGHNHVVLVVKKNKSRLDRLLVWMRGKVPAHVPVLVVDDEADQASVNTGGNRRAVRDVAEESDLTSEDFDGGEPAPDELEPTAINLRIRRLLGLFARCSYVAYTATPFANVLINPSAQDREGGGDLFPKDFIISLPPPAGDEYVGTERLFGRDPLPGDVEGSDGLDVIRIVPGHEVELIVPPRTGAQGFSPAIPPSLRAALLDYLLASAGRLARSPRDEPCTMLVHTDMRKQVQDALADLIEAELAYLRQLWRYDQASLLPELQRRWADFRSTTASVDISRVVELDDLLPYLDQVINPGIAVRKLNSNHLDTADFEAEPTLKAVLVGGNKLSRGVTIEGLLVSYYVRRSPYYDTLLQMGRWFGYRGSYVDLTRLYSTRLLVAWFHDLATVEEDLRRQIDLYALRGLTPLDLAPRIRSHTVMLPTARTKMRDSIDVVESFDGRRLQTLRFPFDRTDRRADFAANLEAVRQLLSGLGEPAYTEAGRYGWHDVEPSVILRFLGDFRVQAQANIDPEAMRSYIHAQNRANELVSWQVLVSAVDPDTRPDSTDLGVIDLGVTGRPRIGMISRSRLANDPESLGVVTTPGDELFGLLPEQIETARRQFDQKKIRSLDEAYRAQRSPQEGLLVIYPISPHSQPGRNAGLKSRMPLFTGLDRPECVAAYAISFPVSKSPATVEYIAGPGASAAG